MNHLPQPASNQHPSGAGLPRPSRVSRARFPLILILIFLLILISAPARAAYVRFAFTNALNQPDTNVFRVVPIGNVIQSDGSFITRGVPIRVTPAADGKATNNLAVGHYHVTNQWLARGFLIRVPNDATDTIYDATSPTNLGGLALSGYNTFVTVVPTFADITNALGFMPGTNGAGGVDAGTVTAIGDTNYLENLNGGATNATLTGSTRLGSGTVSTNQTFRGTVVFADQPDFDSSAPSQSPLVQMQASGALQRSFDLSAGTNFPATSLTGTLPDARLSSAVAMRNANNDFAQSNYFGNDVRLKTPLFFDTPTYSNIWLRAESARSEPTIQMPVFLGQSSASNNTAAFGDPMPDVITSLGINITSAGAVVNSNQAWYRPFNVESAWQNVTNQTQLEAYSQFGTPYTEWGTNYSYRWLNFVPLWDTTTKIYQNSRVDFVTDRFLVGSPRQANLYPFDLSLNNAALSATLTLSGQISITSNSVTSGGLVMKGGIITVGAPDSVSANGFILRTDYNNGTGNKPHAMIYPTGTMKSLFIGQPLDNSAANWTNVIISTNLSVRGLLTTTNDITSRSGNIIAQTGRFIGNGGLITNHGGGTISNSISVLGDVSASGEVNGNGGNFTGPVDVDDVLTANEITASGTVTANAAVINSGNLTALGLSNRVNNLFTDSMTATDFSADTMTVGGFSSLASNKQALELLMGERGTNTGPGLVFTNETSAVMFYFVSGGATWWGWRINSLATHDIAPGNGTFPLQPGEWLTLSFTNNPILERKPL